MIWWARFVVIGIPSFAALTLAGIVVGKLLKHVAGMYEVAE